MTTSDPLYTFYVVNEDSVLRTIGGIDLQPTQSIAIIISRDNIITIGPVSPSGQPIATQTKPFPMQICLSFSSISETTATNSVAQGEPTIYDVLSKMWLTAHDEITLGDYSLSAGQSLCISIAWSAVYKIAYAQDWKPLNSPSDPSIPMDLVQLPFEIEGIHGGEP